MQLVGLLWLYTSSKVRGFELAGEEQADMKEANQERAENAVSMFEGDAPEEFMAPKEGGDDAPAAEEAPAAPAAEE